MSKIMGYLKEVFQPITSKNYIEDWRASIKLERVYHPVSLQKLKCRILHGNIVQLCVLNEHNKPRFRKFHRVCTLENCDINTIEALTPGAAQVLKSASAGAALGAALAGEAGLLIGLAAGVAGSSKEKVKMSMFDREANCDFYVITDLDSAQRMAYCISNGMPPSNISQINEEWFSFKKMYARQLLLYSFLNLFAFLSVMFFLIAIPNSSYLVPLVLLFMIGFLFCLVRLLI